MNMKLLLSCCLLLLSANLLTAQQSFPEKGNRRAGDIMVQLGADATIAPVVAELNRRNVAGGSFFLKKTLAPDWRMYLLGFEEPAGNAEHILEAVHMSAGIAAAQWNHLTESRNVEPNDAQWPNQFDMTLIGMPEAWIAGTGGLTPNGDTIVVAILEKEGPFMKHPDLIGNRWVNYREIEDDGIDNDGNGYVDDYYGWTPRYGSDDPGVIDNHATAVNGIIGAQGNNITGVSGMNWNVKLLNIQETDVSSEVVEGYAYVAKLRQMYNESNGQEGAFIVATNMSFGVDSAFPAQAPLWCAAYDELGAVGIISAVATSNKELNVEIFGDIPSACPSDYMIAVTNVDIADKKVASGFGAESIDLGAPGQGTYNVTWDGQNSGYGTFGGTSAASPHVAGAIAFLYSLGCETLTVDALTEPASCGKRVRDIILNTVSPNPTLDSITVTGGRLDVAQAVSFVRDLCQGSIGPLAVSAALPNPTENKIRFFYETPGFLPYTVRVSNVLGQIILEETITPPQFGVKEYEFDATNLPRGVYFFSIGRGKAVRSTKFIKK